MQSEAMMKFRYIFSPRGLIFKKKNVPGKIFSKYISFIRANYSTKCSNIYYLVNQWIWKRFDFAIAYLFVLETVEILPNIILMF